MSVITMNADVLMGCGGPRAGCERKRLKRAPRRLRSRVMLVAMGIAVLLAGAYGERWVLREAPLPALEYVVATCAAVAVENGRMADACVDRTQISERENHE
jgi:hypothetical protein